jgi:hypothetical protein
VPQQHPPGCKEQRSGPEANTPPAAVQGQQEASQSALSALLCAERDPRRLGHRFAGFIRHLACCWRLCLLSHYSHRCLACRSWSSSSSSKSVSVCYFAPLNTYFHIRCLLRGASQASQEIGGSGSSSTAGRF